MSPSLARVLTVFIVLPLPRLITARCERSLLMRPLEALRASFMVMLMSWQRSVDEKCSEISLQKSLSCMSLLIITTLSRGLPGRMIVPGYPLESRRLPIQLALSGTRSCTGCALPSPPHSLPLRPLVGPNERGSEKYVNVCMSMYVCMYVCTYINIYIYIYIYIYVYTGGDAALSRQLAREAGGAGEVHRGQRGEARAAAGRRARPELVRRELGRHGREVARVHEPDDLLAGHLQEHAVVVVVVRVRGLVHAAEPGVVHLRGGLRPAHLFTQNYLHT